MKQYLDLLRDVRDNGMLKQTRAKLESTGRHVNALSVFGRQIRFDLTEGFPLVTTKRVDFDAIAHELIWFLSGSTNIKYLNDHGIHIWDQWADESGDLGWVYGAQWCEWRGYGDTINQIYQVIQGINAVKTDPAAPEARRLIVTAWNPADLPMMALPPCHAMFQFNVTDGRLSCQLYQRSGDLFLGVPYNIASYALLTHLMAHLTDLQVGEFVHTFGDVHIYENHLDQVDEQLTREPGRLPNIHIDPDLTSIDDVCRESFRLTDYRHWPAIRGEVAV